MYCSSWYWKKQVRRTILLISSAEFLASVDGLSPRVQIQHVSQNSPQQSISENSDTHLIILKQQAAATAARKGWDPTWRPEGVQPIHSVSPHQPGEPIPSPSLPAMSTGTGLASSKQQFTNWWCGYNCFNSVVCQGGSSSTTQPSEELCSTWRLWQRKEAAVVITSNHGYGVRL